MKRLVAAAIAGIGLAAPAQAEWILDGGVAIVQPSSTNSNLELLAIMCGDPYQVELYARGGAAMPESVQIEADYFYKPGLIEARVGDRNFPLVAAGSDGAVVLFAQGGAARNHIAPIETRFIDALRAGTSLVLAFDMLPGVAAADGGPFETYAEFPLEGAAAALDTALAECG